MIRSRLALLATSALFVVGCGDTPAPTQPLDPNRATPTPVPTPSLVPVVTSAEPTKQYYGLNGWLIHGSHFLLEERVTFESGGSQIELELEEQGRPDFIGGVLPATPPGMYSVCVETIHGKGCSRFLVTVE